MKVLLEQAIQEQDKIKKQSALIRARRKVVTSKRFEGTRLFFTMLFGQATILIALFSGLIFLFTEEDWLLLDRVPFFKQMIMEVSAISPKWYIETLILLSVAFLLPCSLGWVISLPVKLFPVMSQSISPDSGDYAKQMYQIACEIEKLMKSNEANPAAIVMVLSSGIGAIAAGTGIVYSGLYRDGEWVFDNLFGTIFGAVACLALAGVVLYALNYVLFLLAYTITAPLEKDQKLFTQTCQALECEWLRQDSMEREKRQRAQADAQRKQQLEKRRREEEKKKNEILKAEAAAWAYQNSMISDSYASLTAEDHDDLDSLTEAMGFEPDVSDM